MGVAIFNSTDSGMAGGGRDGLSLGLAQGQDVSPSQQEQTRALVAGEDAAAKHGKTWENWKTSPNSKPTMDFSKYTLASG